MFEYASTAEARGLQAIIAGAGGAAHLPGMVAAKTLVPVLGVPVPATVLQGVDALLSIVQMPKGVPVGTLAIGKPGAANAALLAAEIVGLRATRGARAAPGVAGGADQGSRWRAPFRERHPSRGDHRHSRRRPARPDDGDGRALAGVPPGGAGSGSILRGPLPRGDLRDRRVRRRAGGARSRPAVPGGHGGDREDLHRGDARDPGDHPRCGRARACCTSCRTGRGRRTGWPSAASRWVRTGRPRPRTSCARQRRRWADAATSRRPAAGTTAAARTS